jgi:prevent-host-death family protein
MITVGAFEAKTKLSELLDRVERGEEIVITRHGKSVARLVGETDARQRDAARVMGAIEAVRDRLRSAGVHFTVADIISARDEGRR